MLTSPGPEGAARPYAVRGRVRLLLCVLAAGALSSAAAPAGASLERWTLLGAPRKGTEAEGTAAVTFTGFEEHPDGSSRLYVKLTHPVPVESSGSGKHLEYVLVGATIPIKNNRNPLITSHFGAQVMSARFFVEGERKKGKSKKKRSASKAAAVAPAARLVVETREPVKPEYRMLQNPDGSAVFTIDFAKPRNPPPKEPDVIAPPPAPKGSDASPVE